MTLNAYMGHLACTDPDDGACLIFAHTAREARKLAWPILESWWMAECWIDVRIRRLRDMPWLYRDADAVKLAADEPHAIECPTVCPRCQLWGLDDPETCCTDEDET